MTITKHALKLLTHYIGISLLLVLTNAVCASPETHLTETETIAAAKSPHLLEEEVNAISILQRLKKAENYDHYLQLLASVRSTLASLESSLENPTRDHLFDLIDRSGAYMRYYELVEAKTPCQMIRGLVIFGYAPRQPDIRDEDLSDSVQEIIRLVPSYCAIIRQEPSSSSPRPLMATMLLSCGPKTIRTR